MSLSGLPAFGANRPPLDPHALAGRILADRRFRIQVRADPDSWWTRFWAWIWSRLDALFGHAVHPGPQVLALIGDAVLLAAAGLVVFAVVRLLMNVAGEAQGTRGGAVRALAPRLAAKDWYNRAVQAAAELCYGAAVVFLFRGALAILDLRGMVHDDPSRTVDESKRELRARAPQFCGGFDAVARAFTTALYAEAPVTQAQWEHARSAYETLFAAVTRVA